MTNIFKAPAEYAEAILAVNGQDRDAAIRFFEFYIGEDERFNGVPGTRQWAKDVLAILRGPKAPEAPEAPEAYVSINGIDGFKSDFDAVAKVAKRLEGETLLIGGTQERDAQEFFQQLVFSVLGGDWAYLGTDRYHDLADRLLAGEVVVNQSYSCPLSYVLKRPSSAEAQAIGLRDGLSCPISPERARFIVDNFVTTGFYQQGKQYAQALTRDELQDLWAYIGSKGHDLVNAWIEALAELVPSTKPQGRLQAAQDRRDLHKLAQGHRKFLAAERSEQLQAFQSSRNAISQGGAAA